MLVSYIIQWKRFCLDIIPPLDIRTSRNTFPLLQMLNSSLAFLSNINNSIIPERKLSRRLPALRNTSALDRINNSANAFDRITRLLAIHGAIGCICIFSNSFILFDETGSEESIVACEEGSAEISWFDKEGVDAEGFDFFFE